MKRQKKNVLKLRRLNADFDTKLLTFSIVWKRDNESLYGSCYADLKKELYEKFGCNHTRFGPFSFNPDHFKLFWFSISEDCGLPKGYGVIHVTESLITDHNILAFFFNNLKECRVCRYPNSIKDIESWVFTQLLQMEENV